MAKNERILVIGATQGTGYEAVKLLLDKGYSVRIFARDEQKAKEKFGDSVELVVGDLRDGQNLPDAVRGVDHVVFTAGVTKRPCKEELIVETEFEGMKKTLAAAKSEGFSGKFIFLSSIGVINSNWASKLLNLIKGNALLWRKRTEDEIKQSGFDYTIVRAGYLMNGDSAKSVALSQTDFPLYLKYRIGRKDVAKLLVAVLETDLASRKTFDAVWGNTDLSVEEQFETLKSDS